MVINGIDIREREGYDFWNPIHKWTQKHPEMMRKALAMVGYGHGQGYPRLRPKKMSTAITMGNQASYAMVQGNMQTCRWQRWVIDHAAHVTVPLSFAD